MDRMALSLGPFALGDRFATGGMGVVHAGRHRRSGVPVAIKLVRADRLDDQAIADFEAEIRAQARIDHPGVVYLFDYGRLPADVAQSLGLPGGTPWLAMERCSSNLYQVGAGLTWKGVRRVLLQLLDALAHAHAVGVLHRDIKLSNVLIAGADDLRPGVKLADFGIAHALADDDETTRAAGTPRYMAPEQVRGEWEALGPWTDLYALGVLAWRLVTGRRPWPQLEGLPLVRAMCRSPLGWPGPRFPLPSGVRAWIDKMTAKDPWKRYQLAADAASELRLLPEEAVEDRWLPAGASLEMYMPRALTLIPGELAVEDVPRAPVFDPRDDPPPESEASIRLHSAGLGLLELRRPAFIGRFDERADAWNRLRRVALRGEAEAFGVVGEPAIGKTRFIEWLTEAAERVGQAVGIPVRCGPSTPLDEAVVGALRAWFRVGTLSLVATRTHLQSWLGEQPWLDDFADLLHRGAASDDRWIDTVTTGLAALGRLRPVILRIEGAGWVPGIDSFVEAVLRQPHAPVLVVVDAPVPGVPELRLPPMRDSSMHRLATALVALDADVRARLVRRAQGRPGILVRTLVHWNAMDLLEEGPHGFVVRSEEVLPPAMAVVATTRLHAVLAQLPPGGRDALERAVVLGDPFSLEAWAAVDGPGRGAIRAAVVRALADRGLIEGTPADYRIPNVAFREAVLAGASERLRSHHARCAAWLAARPGADRLALGRHLLRSGQVEAALEPLCDGLREALEKRGGTSSLALLRELERAVEQLDGARRERWELITAEIRVGMLIDLGELDDAEQVLRGALQRGERLGDGDLLARCWARKGELAGRRCRPGEKRDHLRCALQLQRRVPVGEVARWWMALATAYLSLGDRQRWGQAMASAAKLEGAPAHVVSLGEAVQHQLAGRLERALVGLERALDEAGSVERARLTVLRARAHALLGGERYREARSTFERALEKASAVRVSRVPVLLANLVALDFRLDGPRVALERVEHHAFVLPAGRDEAPNLVPAHCAALAAAALRQDWHKVDYHLERIERHERWGWAALWCNASLLLVATERSLQKGHRHLARRLARTAWTRSEALGASPLRVRLKRLQG